MRELPILFSTPMVQAITEEIKNQTRRLAGLDKVNEFPGNWTFMDNLAKRENVFKFYLKNGTIDSITECKPRYQKGDRLYVKETHRITFSNNAYWECEFKDGSIISKYFKSISLSTNRRLMNRKSILKWVSSMFLLKEFARIWLECTGVRCERLHDITQADCIAEGIEKVCDYGETGYKDYSRPDEALSDIDAKLSYETLWESINGKDSWEVNPWVFIYDFKKIVK